MWRWIFDDLGIAGFLQLRAECSETRRGSDLNRLREPGTGSVGEVYTGSVGEKETGRAELLSSEGLSCLVVIWLDVFPPTWDSVYVPIPLASKSETFNFLTLNVCFG